MADFIVNPKPFDPPRITTDDVRAAMRKIRDSRPRGKRVLVVPDEVMAEYLRCGLPGMPDVEVVTSEFVDPGKVYVFFERPMDLRL